MAEHGPKKINHALFLERTPWDSVDAEYEKRIPLDSPADYVDVLSRQVVAGEAQAWRVFHEGRRAGIVITKIEENRAKEFVICAMYCDAAAVLSIGLGDYMENLARELGCVSIRFHTVRHALATAAAQMRGYRLSEVIMRKNLT